MIAKDRCEEKTGWKYRSFGIGVELKSSLKERRKEGELETRKNKNL